jgi:hypothetical protein
MKRLRDRITANKLSLNEKQRRQELEDDKARKEERKADRLAHGPLIQADVWQLTLDDVRTKREKLEAVAYEREREKHYTDPEEADADNKANEKKLPEPDPIRNETIRIVEDLIHLTNLNKTAAVTGSPAVQQPGDVAK